MLPTQAHRIRSRIEYHGNHEDIEQLCLDGIEINNFTIELNQQINMCINTQYLTVNQCSLKSLNNFPNLPHLVALQAIDNRLKGGDLEQLSRFPHLSFISLDSNEIETVQELSVLKNLTQLQHLEINNNPITNIENYRELIFNMLPSLKILNGQDVFGDTQVLYDTEEQTESEGQSDQENSSDNLPPRKIRRI